MRVISGIAKGRKLKRVPGDTTRPIMDRVKESLFNVLSDFVRETRWLDLFGGTGQVGIEALSRGADEVVFVDNAWAAIRTMEQNLRHTGLMSGAKVVKVDAFSYLGQSLMMPFDLIYVAPPQYVGLWERVLTVVDERPLHFLLPDGIVVVQIDPKEYQELTLKNLVLYDERRYGNTLLCFYEIAATDQ